jgi:hypothetical protein
MLGGDGWRHDNHVAQFPPGAKANIKSRLRRGVNGYRLPTSERDPKFGQAARTATSIGGAILCKQWSNRSDDDC